MALISNGALVDDVWRRVSDEENLPKQGKCIVPQARLGEALKILPADAPLGVRIDNTADPTALVPLFARLALISIAFPAFSDGRGFSLARVLRRAGFAGELRASGRLVADQITHAMRCGFDTIEIAPDLAARQDETQWSKALSAYGAFYQQGYGSRTRILEERRKAAR